VEVLCFAKKIFRENEVESYVSKWDIFYFIFRPRERCMSLVYYAVFIQYCYEKYSFYSCTCISLYDISCHFLCAILNQMSFCMQDQITENDVKMVQVEVLCFAKKIFRENEVESYVSKWDIFYFIFRPRERCMSLVYYAVFIQ
jgi:hypothetical protein